MKFEWLLHDTLTLSSKAKLKQLVPLYCHCHFILLLCYSWQMQADPTQLYLLDLQKKPVSFCFGFHSSLSEYVCLYISQLIKAWILNNSASNSEIPYVTETQIHFYNFSQSYFPHNLRNSSNMNLLFHENLNKMFRQRNLTFPKVSQENRNPTTSQAALKILDLINTYLHIKTLGYFPLTDRNL